MQEIHDSIRLSQGDVENRLQQLATPLLTNAVPSTPCRLTSPFRFWESNGRGSLSLVAGLPHWVAAGFLTAAANQSAREDFQRSGSSENRFCWLTYGFVKLFKLDFAHSEVGIGKSVLTGLDESSKNIQRISQGSRRKGKIWK